MPSSLDFGSRLQAMRERSRAGDTAMLGMLFEAHRLYLLEVANAELDRDLRAKAGPSDLVQQTFLEAARDLSKFRGATEEEFLAWLREILLNNLANLRRHFLGTAKRDLRREVVWDGTTSDMPTAVGEARQSPSHDAITREQALALEQAIERLPDDYRLTIRMRHQQHCSFAEIGEAIGRSAEAARKLWVRAIETLQAELDKS